MKNLALLCSTRHNRTLAGVVFNMKTHTVNKTYIQLPLKPSDTKEEKNDKVISIHSVVNQNIQSYVSSPP